MSGNRFGYIAFTFMSLVHTGQQFWFVFPILWQWLNLLSGSQKRFVFKSSSYTPEVKYLKARFTLIQSMIYASLQCNAYYLSPNEVFLSQEGVLAYCVGWSPSLTARLRQFSLIFLKIFGHCEPTLGGNIHVSSTWKLPLKVNGKICFCGGRFEEGTIR